MDTERLRQALFHRNVLLLFAVPFVPLFSSVHLSRLVPPVLDPVSRPFLLILSIPAKIVSVVVGSPLSEIFGGAGLTGILGGVGYAVLTFYLFAVIAAGIGRVLSRHIVDTSHTMRLRYLFSGSLVLTGAFTVLLATQTSPTCSPPGDCTFEGAAFRSFLTVIGVALCGSGLGLVGAESLFRRLRTPDVS